MDKLSKSCKKNILILFIQAETGTHAHEANPLNLKGIYVVQIENMFASSCKILKTL